MSKGRFYLFSKSRLYLFIWLLLALFGLFIGRKQCKATSSRVEIKFDIPISIFGQLKLKKKNGSSTFQFCGCRSQSTFQKNFKLAFQVWFLFKDEKACMPFLIVFFHFETNLKVFPLFGTIGIDKSVESRKISRKIILKGKIFWAEKRRLFLPYFFWIKLRHRKFINNPSSKQDPRHLPHRRSWTKE